MIMRSFVDELLLHRLKLLGEYLLALGARVLVGSHGPMPLWRPLLATMGVCRFTVLVLEWVPLDGGVVLGSREILLLRSVLFVDLCWQFEYLFIIMR